MNNWTKLSMEFTRIKCKRKNFCFNYPINIYAMCVNSNYFIILCY